jgi:prepilin-type N-terminal cleavage/methylation domain-containing protein
MKKHSKQTGFTIVELLVVIVVIGILAAITIISYAGISQRAAAATLQTDLKNASTQLEIYKADHSDQYPSNEDSLPKSIGTTYQYTLISPVEYCLDATSTESGSTYHISSTSVAVESGSCPIAALTIVSGDHHTCTFASNKQSYCWGFNNQGQLGNNSISDSLVPVATDVSGVLGGKTIKSYAAGQYHTCAVASDDRAYCWGDNWTGALGDNTTTDSLIPVAVNTSGVLADKTVKYITSGQIHTCAIASDDKAYCWGSNSNGQFGNNSTTQSLVPTAVSTSGVLSGKTIKYISAGMSHTCAIASDDKAYCWGYNFNGQLGNNSTAQSLVPVAVNTSGVLSGKTVKFITAGFGTSTCAIANDDNAYCWGNNSNGQLGNNSTTNSSVPVAVNTASGLGANSVKSLRVAALHTCAISISNQTYCWGLNTQGQLGNGTTAQSLVPVATIPLP